MSKVATLQLCTDETPHVGIGDARRLAREAEGIAEDSSVHAVLLVGGARQFCMGATPETLSGDDAPAQIAELMRAYPKILLGLPVPVVAAMSGHAVGGGFAIGLWCDVAVLARESLYGSNFAAIGMTPGMGSTAMLEEALGAPLARELLFTGRLVKGEELRAAHAPLSSSVLPRADVLERAREIAEEIAENPREVLVSLKRSLAGRRRARIAPVLDEEQAMHAALFADPETRRQIALRYGGKDGT